MDKDVTEEMIEAGIKELYKAIPGGRWNDDQLAKDIYKAMKAKEPVYVKTYPIPDNMEYTILGSLKDMIEKNKRLR